MRKTTPLKMTKQVAKRENKNWTISALFLQSRKKCKDSEKKLNKKLIKSPLSAIINLKMLLKNFAAQIYIMFIDPIT